MIYCNRTYTDVFVVGLCARRGVSKQSTLGCRHQQSAKNTRDSIRKINGLGKARVSSDILFKVHKFRKTGNETIFVFREIKGRYLRVSQFNETVAFTKEKVS
jgi:hypothetical protein